MAKTLIEKIGSVLDRRNPDGYGITESYAFDEADDVLKYVKLAMEAVDAKMTAKSKEAAARVKDRLGQRLANVTFQYQGSIMTDTHIAGASDIDLLVLPDHFLDGIKKVLRSLWLILEVWNFRKRRLSCCMML